MEQERESNLQGKSGEVSPSGSEIHLEELKNPPDKVVKTAQARDWTKISVHSQFDCSYPLYSLLVGRRPVSKTLTFCRALLLKVYELGPKLVFIKALLDEESEAVAFWNQLDNSLNRKIATGYRISKSWTNDFVAQALCKLNHLFKLEDGSGITRH